ncbi:hypothetical protein LNTAR_15137 [Lentisphaera araneosa HTCC2155]|uniref:Uncharacterized protein n=1 Tax=Lentisphaera araneosa HTCC2155 TaxID=313628 RepID=A6DRF2_9BACT|nr:hypothetical protein [Lentisphaera araneosa]EDM25762.1 hypothetical protein LNTAR_15137 [Lentisphaera araneosa HTCC2155]
MSDNSLHDTFLHWLTIAKARESFSESTVISNFKKLLISRVKTDEENNQYIRYNLLDPMLRQGHIEWIDEGRYCLVPPVRLKVADGLDKRKSFFYGARSARCQEEMPGLEIIEQEFGCDVWCHTDENYNDYIEATFQKQEIHIGEILKNIPSVVQAMNAFDEGCDRAEMKERQQVIPRISCGKPFTTWEQWNENAVDKIIRYRNLPPHRSPWLLSYNGKVKQLNTVEKSYVAMWVLISQLSVIELVYDTGNKRLKIPRSKLLFLPRVLERLLIWYSGFLGKRDQSHIVFEQIPKHAAREVARILNLKLRVIK